MEKLFHDGTMLVKEDYLFDMRTVKVKNTFVDFPTPKDVSEVSTVVHSDIVTCGLISLFTLSFHHVVW